MKNIEPKPVGLEYWIGVTDQDWFDFHLAHQSTEVNFWAPGGERQFSAIPEGGLFLFKLKSPINKIVGGGWFIKSTTLPLELAWRAYGPGNGADEISALKAKIISIRSKMSKPISENPVIGCTLLTDCFWLPEEQWIDQPKDWSRGIVQGKRYEATTGEGARVWQKVQGLLRALPFSPREGEVDDRYGMPYMTKPRLGQAGFRISVMDAYSYRCAVTEEKTLPVLEAAHIKPYAEGGVHEVSNGILLRSDFHALFDTGYLTFDENYRILISSQIREQFTGGESYYKYHGHQIPNLPRRPDWLPSKSALAWKNRNWKG